MINKRHLEDHPSDVLQFGEAKGRNGSGCRTFQGYCYANGAVPIAIKIRGDHGRWGYREQTRFGDCTPRGEGIG